MGQGGTEGVRNVASLLAMPATATRGTRVFPLHVLLGASGQVTQRDRGVLSDEAIIPLAQLDQRVDATGFNQLHRHGSVG